MLDMQLRKRFDVDDYYGMAGAGILGHSERVELIDGQVVTMAPIGPRHTGCVSAATRALVLAAGDAAIVQPQGPVRLDRFNELQPDLLLLRPRPDFYTSAHAGPDDVLLVVEIADTSIRYDREVKARLYAACGLADYWLADLNANRLWIYLSPDLDGYRNVEPRRRGEMVAPRLLETCLVPVDQFLVG